MFERSEPVLKIICLALALLVLYQCARLVVRRDPLARWKIPASISAVTAPPITPAESKKKEPVVPAPRPEPNRPPPMMMPGQPPGPGRPSLPPAIQARVDRVYQSEILGPVMRPLPMALLGIAGKDALLRAPNGQTGLLREGEELGGIKLVRIGTNRIVIEQEGQKKELTLFSGFGSETLLPKEKENLR